MHEGLVPDVSLGTHFFNDLVELDMLYFALYPGKLGNLFTKHFFVELPNSLDDHVDGVGSLKNIVHVIDARNCKDHGPIKIYMNSMEQRGICFFDH
jgi:pyruvate,water dikinase